MQFLYEFLPIILFFGAYKVWGIYTATAVAIGVSAVQVSWSYYRHKKVEKMLIASMLIILVMGGLTLILRDKSFIMLKPSIINWAFALIFLGTQFIGKKPLVERMMGSQITLTENKWPQLNMAWVGFFIIAGLANLYFALDYHDVEKQLISTTPTISAEQLETLQCEQLDSTESQGLCTLAKSKEELWVNFKLFGILGLTVIFIILQGIWLTRYIQPEAETPETEEK